VGIIFTASAINSVDLSKPYHTLQQISKSSTDTTSIDSDSDGVIDFANSANKVRCPDGNYKEAEYCGFGGGGGNALPSCSLDQIIKWDGTDWVCAADNVGGGENPLPSCAINQTIKWNGSSWICAEDINSPITLCDINQIMKWDGSKWICANDILMSGSSSLCNTVYASSGDVGTISMLINGRNICEDDDGCSYRIWNTSTEWPGGTAFYTTNPIMFRQKIRGSTHYWHDAKGDNKGINGDSERTPILHWEGYLRLYDDCDGSSDYCKGSNNIRTYERDPNQLSYKVLSSGRNIVISICDN